MARWTRIIPRRRGITVLVTLLVISVAVLAPRFRADGISYASDAWTQHHRKKLFEPQLKRYYVFTASDVQQPIPNLVSWNGAAQPGSSQYTRFTPVSVPGSEVGLRSVRVDDRPLEASPVALADSLTIEFRIRHHSEGFVRGGNSPHSGTLVAMGDGVWNGFLFSLDFPSNMLSFQLGHPKPEPARPVVALSRLPADVWTHIAGTWDGNEVRVYVNGLLAGRRNCTGPFFQVPNSSRLRIGYVGNGLGSARFDIEHLAIFGRCFSDLEILQTAWSGIHGHADSANSLLEAGRLLVSGRPQEAQQLLLQLVDDAPVHSLLRSIAEYRLGECMRELRLYEQSARWFNSAASGNSPRAIRSSATLEQQSLQAGLHQSSTMEQRADPNPAQGHALWNQPSDFLRAIHDQHRRSESFAMLEDWKLQFVQYIHPALARSCHSCHSDEGGCAPDIAGIQTALDSVHVGDFFWRQLAKQVVEHQPPLPESALLTTNDRLRLLYWIENRPRTALCEELAEDSDAPRHLEQEQWRVGFGMARRLTRDELRNSVRDLLGVQLSDDQLPPPEGSGGEGFDNVSSTLFTSSMLLETWFQAVESAVNAAIREDLNNPAGQPRRILSVLPAETGDQLTAATACLKKFTGRAWRRLPDEAELHRLLSLYREAFHETDDFSQAMAEAARAVLLSPHFLLVSEPELVDAGEYQLLPEQFATRMALFLWRSLPDDELLNAAASGKLLLPHDIRQQIRRMLRDPKSESLGQDFGLQWLGLQRPEEMQPDPQSFPDWTPATAQLLQEEAVQLVNHILRRNRPLTELLHADYLIANEQLAKYYELPGSGSTEWGILQLPDHKRGGILTLGAVLTVTSRPSRTSPVLRGRWILENILGETVDMPPSDIPVFPEAADPAAPMTLRERLEQHRADPGCFHCHETMDQLGFALEEFDPTGRLRDHDGTGPVDASAILPAGETFHGISGLREVLRDKQQDFLRLFCRRLLAYALGRGIDRFDECVLDRCLEALADEENRADALFEEIILSFPFRHRYALP